MILGHFLDDSYCSFVRIFLVTLSINFYAIIDNLHNWDNKITFVTLESRKILKKVSNTIMLNIFLFEVSDQIWESTVGNIMELIYYIFNAHFSFCFFLVKSVFSSIIDRQQSDNSFLEHL